MRPFKRFLGNDGVRRALCAVAATYIRFVRATTRWQVIRDSVPEEYWQRREPFILAFWHGRLLMMPVCWNRAHRIELLISAHRDGRLLADTMAHLGFDTITGSSSRGGSAALRSMVQVLKEGGCIGITPDGPRGPRMRASDGIVSIARLSGAPVIPATYAVARRKVLGSWDRFIVAWPFNRGVIVWGEPVVVPRDADEAARETARQTIETRLNAIADEADRLVGQTTVEPAPLPSAEAVS